MMQCLFLVNVLLHRVVHVVGGNVFSESGQNLGKALAVPSNPLASLSDGHLLPIIVLSTDSLHVNDVLLA